MISFYWNRKQNKLAYWLYQLAKAINKNIFRALSVFDCLTWKLNQNFMVIFLVFWFFTSIIISRILFSIKFFNSFRMFKFSRIFQINHRNDYFIGFVVAVTNAKSINLNVKTLIKMCLKRNRLLFIYFLLRFKFKAAVEPKKLIERLYRQISCKTYC